MPKLDANLQFLFNEYDVLDRYDAAARSGFRAVELQSPYELPEDAVAERLERNGLVQVLINLPVDDPETGQRNVAIRPDRRDVFQERVETALGYASALQCRVINFPAGPAPDGFTREALRETFIQNLRYAAPRFAGVGTQVVIEAINTRDQPGFFVHRTGQAREIVEAAGVPNLGIQYDVYHMQIMEGDLARTIESSLPWIGHIQVADTPGRHEPGTGEISYPFIVAFLDRLGYTGYVGAEYRPSGRTEDSLEWAKPYLGGG